MERSWAYLPLVARARASRPDSSVSLGGVLIPVDGAPVKNERVRYRYAEFTMIDPTCQAGSHCISLPPHARLTVLHELLLRANNASRPHDTQPSNHLLGSHFVMFHHVAANAATGPTQPSLAMNSNSATHILNLFQELGQQVIGRIAAVQEVQLHVVNALGGESLGVIVLLVESDDQLHVSLFEVGDVVVGAERVISSGCHLVRCVRSGKCDELSIKTPIQIAVLYLLEMLVLFDVESRKIEKPVLPRLGQAVESIEDGQHERAGGRCGVVPVREGRGDCLERSESILRVPVHVQNRPRSDQKSRIGALVRVLATVVVDGFIFELWVA